MPQGPRDGLTPETRWLLELINAASGTPGPPGPQGPAGAAGAQGPPGDIAGAWPVGSVFTSVVATSPATLLGFGTWAAFAAGRVLIGLDAGDPDFNVAEETGGAKTVASAGTVSQPTFTGQAVQSSSVSGGTPTGTIAWPAGVPAFAGTQGAVPAETISWPAGVPTFAGAALGTHGHTFTGNALGTHAHELPIQLVSGTSGRHLASSTFGTGTSRAAQGGWTKTANTTSAAVALSQTVSAGTPAGTNTAVSAGTPTGTIAWPAGVPTNSTVNFTPAGTIAWPAGVPTFAGSALSNHDHAITAAGTVSQPTFTGAASSVLQPYIVVYFWKRTA